VNKNQHVANCVKELNSFYTKDHLALKDLLLVKIRQLEVAESVGLPVWSEGGLDWLFSEIEEIIGSKLEDIPLASLPRFCSHSGRPRKPESIDSTLKLCLLWPYHELREWEYAGQKSKHLAGVRTKDKRNPHYQRALRRAASCASTSAKRAWERAYGGSPPEVEFLSKVASSAISGSFPSPDSPDFEILKSQVNKAVERLVEKLEAKREPKKEQKKGKGKAAGRK